MGRTLIYIYLAVAATMPPREDEAHRLDRIETKRLNEAVLTRSGAARELNGLVVRPLTAGERDLKLREDQAVHRWRQAQSACGADQQKPC